MSAQFQLQKLETETSMSDWEIINQQAKILVSTGFLPPSIKTPEQAVAIILQGRELGIPTMAALGTINVIQNKPTVSPQLMLALINRSGQCENIEITNDPDGVTCTMKRRGRIAHTEFFGAKEAAAMGLTGKDNYKKQAMTMFRWRAVAACARIVFPDVVLGIYTPEEMGAENVNELGELVPEPATIHRLPTKGQLTIQPSAGVLKNRALIKDLLESVGVNPQRSLNKYDTLSTDAERADALEKVKALVAEHHAKNDLKQAATVIDEQTIRGNKISEIEAVLSSESWTMTEDGTTEFLAKFTGGEIVALGDMSGDELDAVIAELVELGNLPM